MTEVEAICAKLQNKPSSLINIEEDNNNINNNNINNNNNNNLRKRKRKANTPKNILRDYNIDNNNNDIENDADDEYNIETELELITPNKTLKITDDVDEEEEEEEDDDDDNNNNKPLDLSIINPFDDDDDYDEEEDDDIDDEDDERAQKLKSCFSDDDYDEVKPDNDDEDEDDDDEEEEEDGIVKETNNDSGSNDDSNIITLPSFLQNTLVNICLNKELSGNKLISNLSKDDKLEEPVEINGNTVDNVIMKYSITDPKSDISNSLFDYKISPNKDSVSNSSLYDLHEESIRRFSSYEECKEDHCQQELLRDHFHCMQCKKTIVRREEMIRHSKWHKKREESLQFNFMRFSPTDDCKDFTCTYNGRQTHYHCLHPGCLKIYISTSDVQMHSNFHKKDAAINQEGFQRYRATELCGLSLCPYNNQRTTHFHCMRSHCRFTFKNKADMDKHKSHHQKNDLLAKEGFKKFIKYEHCDFANCKFSKVMNHIHCIRDNCDYVVHSSAQINSHRRKHDRRIISGTTTPNPIHLHHTQFIPTPTAHIPPPSLLTSLIYSRQQQQQQQQLNHNKTDFTSILNLTKDNQIDKSPTPMTTPIQQPQQQQIKDDNLYDEIKNQLNNWELNYDFKIDFKLYNDKCITEACTLMNETHYHCIKSTKSSCQVAFKSTINNDILYNHSRRHKLDELLFNIVYKCCNQIQCCNSTILKQHYHCKWSDCSYTKLLPEQPDNDYSFIQEIYDHFITHESKFVDLINQIRSNNDNNNNNSNNNSNNERKRGRPPKYKKNVFIPRIDIDENDIKDDENIIELTKQDFLNNNNIKCGFKYYPTNQVFCIDDLCMFYGRTEHYHCLRSRCYHATDSLITVNLHRREFHHYMQIEDGYEYFDPSINCRRTQCQNNRVNNHYHCVRQNCDYSFKRFNTMHQHTKKHLEIERSKMGNNNNNHLDIISSPSSNELINNNKFKLHDYKNNNNNNNNNNNLSLPMNNELFKYYHPFIRNNHSKFNHYNPPPPHLTLPPPPPPPQSSHTHQQPQQSTSHIPNNSFFNFNSSLFAFQNTLKNLMNNNNNNNNNLPINNMTNYLANFFKLSAEQKIKSQIE